MRNNLWIGSGISGMGGIPMLGTGARGLTYLIREIFRNGGQGFAYDPNDLNTLYQDAAGTIPVTAAGQPVGLMLDKSKGGAIGINLHTTDTPINTTSYPATNTRSGLDITVSQKASGYASVSLGMPTVVGKTYLLELIAPDVAGFWVLVSDNSSSDSTNRRTVISTAPISKINTKITFIFTASEAVTYIHLNRGASVTSPATFKDVSVREVLGNHAYQDTSASRPILRKNAVTGANYLEFDGSDDFLQTGNIDFTSTDKVSLFAGVRKLSDAAIGAIMSSLGGNGSFEMYQPSVAGSSDYVLSTSGSTGSKYVTATRHVAPNSSVLAAKVDIGLDLYSFSISGKVFTGPAADLGSGNYGNYPLYIGRRGGVNLPFNGHLYGLIGIGRLTTDSETKALEKAIAKNTGVTLNV